MLICWRKLSRFKKAVFYLFFWFIGIVILASICLAVAPPFLEKYLREHIAIWPFWPAGVYAPAQADFIFQKCSTGQVENCYDKELSRVTKENGLYYGINTLHSLQDLVPFLRNCHVQGHVITNAATLKNPEKWKEILNEVNPEECGGGLLHGVLEVHIGDDPSFHITADSIKEICGTDPLVHRVRSCTHFIGHLKLFETLGDIKAALPTCGTLNPTLRYECDNGVFMEDSFKLTFADHGLAETPVRDEARMLRQRERCSKYSGVEGEACWTDLAEIFAELYNYDAAKTYQSCLGAPNENERRRCYMKAVIIMASSPDYDDPGKLIKLCSPRPNFAFRYEECLASAISASTFYSLKLAPRAATLCSLVELQFQNYCFHELGNKITQVGGPHSVKLNICSFYPEFSNVCMNG